MSPISKLYSFGLNPNFSYCCIRLLSFKSMARVLTEKSMRKQLRLSRSAVDSINDMAERIILCGTPNMLADVSTHTIMGPLLDAC